MKPNTIIIAAFLSGLLPASAQLTIPSDGTDGALNITESTVIDLTLAADGAWNSPGNGNGVYDPNQWAVVFKYSSVNIAAGATVTFTNHRTHAPVVWLVQGNVTIDGELNLDGRPGLIGVAALLPVEPGPGGFRGGPFGPSGFGAGYGPGGQNGVQTNGAKHRSVYGNPQIVPLIGGSGAGATGGFPNSGSGGGGAILIAASSNVFVGGKITARGGSIPGHDYAVGSGGSVRIVATGVSGVGSIDCTDRSLRTNTLVEPGRIRIETNSLASSLTTAPETIRVAPANPPVIWPAANAPKVRVVSVDSVNAPADPNAPLIASADVAIQNNSPVNIVLEATDFPIEGVVQLSIIPKFGNRTIHTAERIDGNIAQSTWRVTTTLPQGFVTLQARATQP